MMDASGGNATAVSGSAPTAGSQAGRRLGAERVWPIVGATLLGLVVVLGVGFSPGIAHNAAHDTRHTLSFPCH